MRSISVDDLQPGMTLARTIINNDMVVILSEGTLLTKAHITRLNFLNIPTVYIKDEYELSPSYQSVEAMLKPSNAFVSKYKEVIHTAKDIFDATGKGGKIPMQETTAMVKNPLLPMVQQSGVIDYLFELNHLASDVYNHSLRVSILAGVIAKWLNFSSDKIHELILAGFLHDIGKTKFDARLIEKRIDTLKGSDLDAYIQHTLDGNHILSESGSFSDGIKLAAMQHHERLDGSGFPFGSAGNDIHEYARIIMIADLYDNITTEREGQVKRTPFDALNQIAQDMYKKLDPQICVPFLRHSREAFLGSVVMLSNGLKGIIVHYPEGLNSQPMVRISQEVIINLEEQRDITIVEYNPT